MSASPEDLRRKKHPPEYYVLWFQDDIPKGIITGPFQSAENAQLAAESLKVLDPERDLRPAGGDLFWPACWR